MTEDREDRIRRRAYALWQQEGEPHGRHEAHWRQAAQEVGPSPEAPSPAHPHSPWEREPEAAGALGMLRAGDQDVEEEERAHAPPGGPGPEAAGARGMPRPAGAGEAEGA